MKPFLKYYLNYKKIKMLCEGGNAFANAGSIHIDEIEPTLNKLSSILGIDLVNNALGSVGKREFSGDIDIAIDLKPEEKKDFIAKLKTIPEVLGVNNGEPVTTLVEIVNFDESKQTDKPRTGFVQVDFMQGNPAWLKTYYHSPTEQESEYKGVFRNIMIASIAAVYDREDSEETIEDGRPVKSLRYMWSPRDGLVKVLRTPKEAARGGYTQKNINKIVEGPYKTSEEIAKALGLGGPEALNSYETLKAAIEANYPADVVRDILNGFKSNYQIKQMGIPSDLSEVDGVEDEEKAGNRVGIKHLYSLNKPDQYSMDIDTMRAFIQNLSDVNGVIEPGNTTISEKADGLAFKFGKEGGRFFMQSSYSGRVFEPEEFRQKIKFEPVQDAFVENFEKIQQLTAKSMAGYDDIEIQAEWLYSPLATKRDDRPGYVYFVATDYREEELGTWSTFVLINGPDDVLGSLLKINNPEVKFLPTAIEEFPTIDLRQELKTLTDNLNRIDSEVDLEVLSMPARKKDIRERKKAALAFIHDLMLPVQKSMYFKIYETIEEIVGSIGDVEGVVIKLGDLMFKINNPEFMKRKFNV
jgi:hypothetical protein